MNTVESPRFIAPEQLRKAQRTGDQLLVVGVEQPERFATAHIPAAVRLDYADITASDPPVSGLIPSEAALSQALGAIGLSPKHYVVAYDSEGGGRAARLLYTLDALGHEWFSLLDGGLQAWQAAGLPTESGPSAPQPTSYKARLGSHNVANKADIRAWLGDAGFALLDTRSRAEYDGSDLRAAKGGHIPGAAHLEWTEAMQSGEVPRLKPRAELQAMLTQRGINPEKEVVVYCQTHHRSAHTYMLLKHLGYPRVRGYPGAWSDWGNDPDMPVER